MSDLGMGSMGEGGGNNFYMGGDQPQEEQPQQNPEDIQNPELVVQNPAKESETRQNRQYLEELVTGKSWINPWEVPAPERSEQVIREEKEEMLFFSGNTTNSGQKLFIINA